ncbi:MAG: carboxypeptidase-like regulatory domain-containing protein [Candidatus Staskawiczbacteria bacterium]
MKKSQHTSKGIAQARQLEISKNVHQSFVNDNKKFEQFDPELDTKYANNINNKIQEVENIPPDYVLVAQQMQETQRVISLSNMAISNIRTIKYYIEKAFAEKQLYLYEFGYPELKKAINSQSKMILLLKNYVITLDKYRNELSQKGLSQTIIDDMHKISCDLDNANIKQEQAKKARYIATGNRVKAFDELWQMIGNIAKAGKILFETEPDYQRNYILDDSPKPKTPKIANKEAETAILQGNITNAQTNETIEDAIIEIKNTTLNATTDEDGEFYIDQVIPATYTLKITAVGYKELEIKNIELASNNEEQEFSFSLEQINIDAV